MLPFNLLTGEADMMVKSLAYGLGGAGLLGLYTAILIPHRQVRRFAAVRWGVLAGIGCGLASTGILLFMTEGTDRIAANLDAYQIWLFGGPVLTGGWNIFQLSTAANSQPAAVAAAS